VKQKSLQRQAEYDSREMLGFDDGWEADRTPPPREQAGYQNCVGFAVLSSMTPGFLKSSGGTIGSERGAKEKRRKQRGQQRPWSREAIGALDVFQEVKKKKRAKGRSKSFIK